MPSLVDIAAGLGLDVFDELLDAPSLIAAQIQTVGDLLYHAEQDAAYRAAPYPWASLQQRGGDVYALAIQVPILGALRGLGEDGVKEILYWLSQDGPRYLESAKRLLGLPYDDNVHIATWQNAPSDWRTRFRRLEGLVAETLMVLSEAQGMSPKELATLRAVAEENRKGPETYITIGSALRPEKEWAKLRYLSDEADRQAILRKAGKRGERALGSVFGGVGTVLAVALGAYLLGQALRGR